MERQRLKPLGWQQNAFAQARNTLDGIRARGHADLSVAIARDPTLVSEAAKGRTARAIRAMQLEAEVRTNPELGDDHRHGSHRAAAGARAAPHESALASSG